MGFSRVDVIYATKIQIALSQSGTRDRHRDSTLSWSGATDGAGGIGANGAPS